MSYYRRALYAQQRHRGDRRRCRAEGGEELAEETTASSRRPRRAASTCVRPSRRRSAPDGDLSDARVAPGVDLCSASISPDPMPPRTQAAPRRSMSSRRFSAGSTTSRLYRRHRRRAGDRRLRPVPAIRGSRSTIRGLVYASPRGSTSLDRLPSNVDAGHRQGLVDGARSRRGADPRQAAASPRRRSMRETIRCRSPGSRRGARHRPRSPTSQEWLNRIEAVTADQVVAAARHLSRPRRSVTGNLVGVAARYALRRREN